jgi:pimeloyl-ACP methyl ester carboxylesterase
MTPSKTIICFHGSPGLPKDFDQLKAQLPHHHLITPQRDEVVTLKTAAFVIGYSWGIVPALMFSATHLKQVRGLLLVSPFLPGKTTPLRRFLIKHRRFSQLLFGLFGTSIVTSMVKRTSIPGLIPPDYALAATGYTCPHILHQSLVEKERHRLTDIQVKEVSQAIPIHLMIGSHDMITRDSTETAALISILTPVTTRVIKKAGHALIFTHSKAIAEMIKESYV